MTVENISLRARQYLKRWAFFEPLAHLPADHPSKLALVGIAPESTPDEADLEELLCRAIAFARAARQTRDEAVRATLLHKGEHCLAMLDAAGERGPASEAARIIESTDAAIDVLLQAKRNTH